MAETAGSDSPTEHPGSGGWLSDAEHEIETFGLDLLRRTLEDRERQKGEYVRGGGYCPSDQPSSKPDE